MTTKLTTHQMIAELETLPSFEWHVEPEEDGAAIVRRTFAAYAPMLASRHAKKLQAALSAFPGDFQITLTSSDRLGEIDFRQI